ncbi:MAG: sulfatase [Acidobacteriota bacterium]|nr:sulfatase [Acidobacteriota bacterium]
MKPSSIQATHSGSTPESTRFATLRICISAVSLFALIQAGFILVRQQHFDVGAAIGLSKAGVIAAVPTVLGLTLLVLLTRRWHRASKQGDPHRATRSMLFGSVAAVSAWMIADAWVSGPLIPTALEIWIEIAAALAIGIAVAWRPPSALFCRRASYLAAVAILVLLLPMPDTGFVRGSEGEAKSPTGGGRVALDRAPDVVLISVDTFRADRVGAYGSSLTLTPEIDRFAAEGLVFERAVAASPWTVPSVASMLTGLPTIRHGAGRPLHSGLTFVRSALVSDAVTVAQRFSAAGYRTRAVVANGFLSPALGIARGFDEYDTPFLRATGSIFLRDIPLARLVFALYPVEKWADYRAQGVTDRALEILEEDAPEPLFLWVHYIDLHTPFQADPAEFDLGAWSAEIHQDQPKVREDGTVVGDFFAGTSNVRGGMLWLDPTDRQRIAGYYDRAVAYVDGELGRLFGVMRDSGRDRPLVAAVTSDHGEEFWDHGHFEHGHDYYREVTRIPLILWSPGRVPSGRVGAQPVGLVDVAPTLLDLAGLEAARAETPDEGESLVALWENESAAGESNRIRFSEGNLYGMPSVLLEEGTWRFILRAHGAGELYHAFDDPLELENRVAEEPELVARYRKLIEPRLAFLLQSSGNEAPALDAETRKALQSLGYIQ